MAATAISPPAPSRRSKVSCETCYFGCNLLCALDKTPCATYRPNAPEGLRPPRQLRFVFRQPGRTNVAFAFPDAQAQAARYG
jgi:hypothetical protein